MPHDSPTNDKWQKYNLNKMKPLWKKLKYMKTHFDTGHRNCVIYLWQSRYKEAHYQGILSLPEIAGYEWVLARIGRFYRDKIFFHNTNGPLKTGKTGTHLSAVTSPDQCSLTLPILVYAWKTGFANWVCNITKECYLKYTKLIYFHFVLNCEQKDNRLFIIIYYFFKCKAHTH